ncbi:hypothetical protein EKD04_022525 [Chloroflexales bacterium ZM16-3]|nr:hypothetical protein [Chloroflexales bacterium ZM16-3]
MANDNEARSAVFIEETYNYTIIADTQTEITCTGTSGQVRVTVPYDGRSIGKAAPGALIDFGQLRLRKPSQGTAWSTCPIQLPIGTDLPRMLRNNRESVWEWSYIPDAPRDTLLNLEAAVIDGAALDPSMDDNLLAELLFHNVEAFVNDLRLRLKLWVPRLNTAALIGARGHELRGLILEQESKVQIFLPSGASEELLAQSLAALANTAGGRLLIGVGAQGTVDGLRGELADSEAIGLRRLLLQAALRCDPPVVFAPPAMLEDEDGRRVARVNVPPGQSEQHVYQDKLWLREGPTTVSKARSGNRHPAPAPQPLGDLANLVAAGPTADVIMLGSKGVEVTANDLGRAITALVNAAVGQGLIVVRHLAPPQGWTARLASQNANQSFEKQLRSALEGICPQIFNPRPEYATIEGERVVVLRIKGHQPTVATYKGAAYEWTGTALREVDHEELYRRYMLRSGQQLHSGPSGDTVTLLYGEISWPSHPPTRAKLSAMLQQDTADKSLAHFDHQVRAMVWHNLPFSNLRGTQGSGCLLNTGLRHAFARPSNPGATSDLNLNGVIQIRIDNVLASGTEYEIQANHPLIQGVPVYKRTQLIANLQLNIPELFANRQRAALLHFQIPDVAAGRELEERIFDLQQICADVGFWVAKPSPSSELWGLLRGIRNTGHRDISLALGFRCTTTDVARELRFSQRVDHKQIKVGHLDVRIVLSGVGDKVSEELTSLQMELSQLIHDRLYYLRTE